MRRTRNRGVIFTGRVGSRMRVGIKRPNRRMAYLSFLCNSGPWRGKSIRLDKWGDHRTLPIVINGQAGQYVGANWLAATTPVISACSEVAKAL